MSEIQEADIEVEETNISPSKNMSSDSFEKLKNMPSPTLNDHSNEKRLVEEYKSYEKQKLISEMYSSEEKLVDSELTPITDAMIDYKTPDKVPTDYFEDSSQKQSDQKLTISNFVVTPNKQLETITEQPTNLEMDITGSNFDKLGKHSNYVKISIL